jgi:peptide deformylase
MANCSVLKFPDSRLKLKSQPVVTFDGDLRSLVGDMLDTLDVQMGAGLAAPQIGMRQRVVIIRCDSFGYEHPIPAELISGSLVLVNPELELFGEKMVWEESCLSVPGYSGKVERNVQTHVKYHTIAGDHRAFTAPWPLSGALQHECDHLDGILYVERADVSLKRRIFRDLQEAAAHAIRIHRRAKKEARRERIANFDPRKSHGPGKRRKKKRKKR